MTKQLIPSVEKRISTWIEIQKKRKEQEMKGESPKLTLTISREFGCEGYSLSAQLKEKLDKLTNQTWTIFDNEFVDKLVSDQSLSKHLAKVLGDRAKYLDYIISSLLPTWKSETEVFKTMVEAIYSIAQQGNAIILERGAFAITKNLSNCFHFRLIAPIEYRADAYSRRTGISIEEARNLVLEKEEDRTKFLSYFLNCSFDEEKFHVVYNNSKFPIEKIADSIIDLIGI
ncbi:cytidylate kinase-like family protein [bacterium]|nr:cytidylate kinase-like family protein [bacterium]